MPLQSFNPVGAFQGARQNALTIQGQEQGIAQEAQAAPIRNQMQQLGLSQAQKTASRGDTEFDQGQAIKRAQVLNQFARAFKGLDPSQRQAAFQKSVPRLQEFGIDTQQFEGSQFTDPELDQAIAETQGFINDPTSLSSAQRERAGLIEAIQPALDENGKLKID